MVPNTSAVWTAQSSCSMNLHLLWREMVKRRVRVPHSVYRASGARFVANGHHQVAHIGALSIVVSVPSRWS
jgi:hypothetical protein